MKYNIRSSAWFGFGILSLLLKGTAFAIPVEVANAPSDNLDLTVSAIQSAQQTLNLNIYELDSPQIVDAILNRIQAGVKVQILEEGGPVGGLSTAEVGVQGQLVQAMNGKSGDHLFEMKKIKTKRRYRYDHAKYAVIDGNTLLVGSENYSPTGNPVPGTLGNRGWEVVIHDASISEEFSSIFAIDADPSAGDVTELTSNQSTAQKPRRFETVEALPASIFINAPALTAQSLDASQVQRVTSPDTSLSGIVAAIQQAQTSIDIEQMTFDTDWKGAASSPVLDAVEAAAARGVKVRVLLNDDSVFDHTGTTSVHKNTITADGMNQLASQKNLSLTAIIANVKAMGVDYIHNKGMLIDGNVTLVSSINWDENSFENNREAAVLITSPAINEYYESLFNQDWQASGGQSNRRTNGDQTNSDQNSSATNFNCPAKLHVSIQVGKLTLGDQDDRDFASLQDLKVDQDYTVQKNSNECILMSGEAGSKVEGKSFLQFRTNADGVSSVIFEGYTPTACKLFSIRSKLDALNDVTGNHAAEIFDGSGPGREMIGEAVINLSM